MDDEEKLMVSLLKLFSKADGCYNEFLKLTEQAGITSEQLKSISVFEFASRAYKVVSINGKITCTLNKLE